MKRLLDIVASFIGLVLLSPFLLVGAVLVWLQDFRSPFYIPERMGLGGRKFQMVKLRSMVHRADDSGVTSTAGDDPRITGIGRFIRRFKLDEFPQLWNVFLGEMSLVGPRPNVEAETCLYTEAENHLLDVRPGITDIASIVFADESDILRGSEDPDLAYNQLIRPWKSRMGLLYVEHASFWLDVKLILITALAMVCRRCALCRLSQVVEGLGASEELCAMARREKELEPHPPPGSESIVTTR
ncbi:MAG: sugar transferase [Verrucomicrobiales bacterium]|nr:sugar transferase [Verrucomicrobiales bacterium]